MANDLLPKLSNIKEARSLIDKYIHVTPVLQSTTLDKLLGGTNYLKAEIFQKTGSFKVRGALNKILHLSEEEKLAGVIAVSAGNHAQAVAWAAKIAGVSATIIMPENASHVKIAATRAYGAEVILFGKSSIEAFAELDRLCSERQLTLVHPFDDFDIIAGAGSLALESLGQINVIDNIFVPVGGGGLLSGIAIAGKNLSPVTKVIGVEPEGANAIFQSLQKKEIVKLLHVNTIADGLASPYAGKLTYQATSQFVDEIICVSDEDIKKAMKFLFEHCKLVVEPAGAAGLAVLLSGKYKTTAYAKNVIVLSGGNIDLHLLATL